MFDAPGLLQLAVAKARFAAARQSVIATNIANADTPNYRAKDLEPFEAFVARSRSASLSPDAKPRIQVVNLVPFGDAAPNGNTVSLETEMMRAGKAARDHDAAVTIYAKAIGFLHAALGKKR